MTTFQKATGEKIKGTWKWEPVKWTKGPEGLYHSNRDIPDEFWNKNWKRRHKIRDIAGIILLRKNIHNRYEVFVVQCYNNKYGFPKGSLLPKETFEEAAIREFYEETGTKLECPLTHKISFKKANTSTTVTFFIIEKDHTFDIKTKPIADVEITAYGWIELHLFTKLPISNLASKANKLITN